MPTTIWLNLTISGVVFVFGRGARARSGRRAGGGEGEGRGGIFCAGVALVVFFPLGRCLRQRSGERGVVWESVLEGLVVRIGEICGYYCCAGVVGRSFGVLLEYQSYGFIG